MMVYSEKRAAIPTKQVSLCCVTKVVQNNMAKSPILPGSFFRLEPREHIASEYGMFRLQTNNNIHLATRLNVLLEKNLHHKTYKIKHLKTTHPFSKTR